MYLSCKTLLSVTKKLILVFSRPGESDSINSKPLDDTIITIIYLWGPDSSPFLNLLIPSLSIVTGEINHARREAGVLNTLVLPAEIYNGNVKWTKY